MHNLRREKPRKWREEEREREKERERERLEE